MKVGIYVTAPPEESVKELMGAFRAALAHVPEGADVVVGLVRPGGGQLFQGLTVRDGQLAVVWTERRDEKGRMVPERSGP